MGEERLLASSCSCGRSDIEMLLYSVFVVHSGECVRCCVVLSMLCCTVLCSPCCDRLVSVVIKALASRAEDSRFEFRLQWNFSWSSHTSDLRIGTPVVTLPGAW